MRNPSSHSPPASPHLRIAAPDDARLNIDGRSSGMAALKRDIRAVARDGEVTVLILGESGTGKERVARAIHRLSRRHRAPFVVVNCAALSPTLIEDELFGHVRGAFTGALVDKPGPFERADGGTVFLDEIGDLAPELQLKLLRTLQQRTVQRLGGRDEQGFDAQIVAATNVDLAAAVGSGRIREDLYYRLKVFELRVPPLRERGIDDLRDLVTVLLNQACERRGLPVCSLAPSAWVRLESHSWPGNVRELENTLERMLVAASDARTLTTGHLPGDFGSCPRRPPAPGGAFVQC